MYLLTLRNGLQTRHIGPYESPARAAEELDALLASCGGRTHWQIHALEAPLQGAHGRRASGSASRDGKQRSLAFLPAINPAINGAINGGDVQLHN